MAKGGYLIYSDYEDKEVSFTAIFLVRDAEGVIFRQDEDGGFSINNIKYINTEKLAMACRINHKFYSNGNGRYLSLTRRSQQREISDYFTDWVGTANSESSQEFTQSLYDILNKIAPPINPETRNEYTIDEFRKSVYDYIKNQPGKVVNLQDMSMYFYQDRNVLPAFAEENGINVNTEFKAHVRTLNKFVSVRVRRDGIELKFSRNDFGEGKKVWISADSSNVVMVESKEFADELRKEMIDNNE